MDAIYDFAKNITGTDYEAIPKEAVEAAKKEILDSLATALGGSSKDGIRELVDVVKEWGGREQSTVIAYGLKCPAPNAAQINGAMIHALDYDDGHPIALVHVGCVAVPTCFAVAERMGKKTGKELVTALAVGADFVSRLGLASRPGSSLRGSGWHPTAAYGYFSAAAIAGKLIGLDEERMVNALGIAYHQSAGNGQCVEDGALTKRMGPGLAARGGITAALMAERGITGAKNILEGKFGMFNVYHGGDYDAKTLTADLGKRFEGVNVTQKPFSCCGFTHPFIEATLNLMRQHGIKPEQVREVTVYGGEAAYGISVPLEVKCAPRNVIDSQFSVPWVVATSLVKGKVTLEDFTEEAIKNEDVLKTAQKITAQFVPEMTRHGVGPGRVKIVMNDGTEYVEEVKQHLGSVERPMTFEDCANKFRDCAPSSIKPLSADTVERVIEMVKQIEGLNDAAEIIRLLG
jgi:2-methylcitrate dehydratase PrpD